MTCSVAVSSSPVFSPSSRVIQSSLFLSKIASSSSSSSPETLTLTLSHLKPPQAAVSSSSSASPKSPCSPFRLRVLKPPTGLSSSSSAPAVASSSPPSVLKRKRPAKLDIPIASLSFSVPAAATPAASREAVEVDGEGYSVYCKRGRREAMEDRYSAVNNLQGEAKQAFFGVFDGHGGAKAAEFAAENLEKNIFDEIKRRVVVDDDEAMEEAVRDGYLKTDSEFLKKELRGGACCVTALIREGNLVVSNAGDCRAVMSRDGVAEALTSDHRPSREDEKSRIEKLGGYVDLCHGMWRIQGSLAVSRGIGDAQLKKWVIAEPETKIIRIEREHEFLILASDGLWDKVTNQEAIDIARPLCVNIDNKPEPFVACKKLVDLAVSRGSSDDTSVMLIQLGRYI